MKWPWPKEDEEYQFPRAARPPGGTAGWVIDFAYLQKVRQAMPDHMVISEEDLEEVLLTVEKVINDEIP